MKKRVTRPLLRSLSLILVLAAAALLSSAPQPRAFADDGGGGGGGTCVKAGTLTTMDGKVACDCSSTINKGDCSCIYSCGNLNE